MKTRYLVEVQNCFGTHTLGANAALAVYRDLREKYFALPIIISRVEQITLEDLERAAKEPAPTIAHGPCCTCQECGEHYDDCRCGRDAAKETQ